MHRTASLALAAGLLLGCGSSGSDGAAPDDHWPRDAEGPAGTGMGVRVTSRSVATLSPDRACTSEEGAEGDRWCGFLAMGDDGEHNLFVLNVSQVIAGAQVSCEGDDPNCLFLLDHVEGDVTHPTYFAGDTLIYYDRELTAYAWRPGMTTGRVLARREHVRDISYCAAAARGTAVMCLSTPYEQPAGPVVLGDIYAGSAEGESEPLLAPITSVIAATLPDNASVHRLGFSALPDGYVAWSARETLDGPEVLKLQHHADASSLITVASDVHQWTVTPDGRKWLWLRAINELGVGTLETANFPDGSEPTVLLADVFDYELNASGALVATTEQRDAVAFPDPSGAPDASVLIDSGIGRVISVSDQGHIAYAKSTTGSVFNVFAVSSLDGSVSCVLEQNGGVSLNAIQFSPGVKSVLWARSNSGKFDAFHSRLGDCETAAFSPDVRVIGWVGGSNAVFIDTFDARSESGTLRFRRIGKDGSIHPDEPALIAENVDTHVTWAPDFVLYTVSAGSEADGLYVRAFGR